MITLTVVIPTYNRNEILLRTLSGLSRQLTSECQLLILDNHSAIPIAESLAGLLSTTAGKNIKVVRHPINLGAEANILRSFELCESEWLWILGDDDEVEDDAIARILQLVTREPNAAYVSFLTRTQKDSGHRPTSIVSAGVSEFILNLDYAHHINFMSCSIWRTRYFADAIRSGYRYAYAMGWTHALLLHSLGAAGRTVLVGESLIKTAGLSPPSARWGFRHFLLGWPTLLEAPLDPVDRERLARKLLTLLSPENVVAYLLADSKSSPAAKRYYLSVIAARVSPYRVHRFGRTRFFAYRLLFIHPRLGWKMVRSAIQLANRWQWKHIDVQDLEERLNG